MFMDRKRRVLLAAFGGALILAGTGNAVAAVFRADMSDNTLTAGDPDGWGRARVRVDDTLNMLCTDLEVRSIGQVTSAKIYRGAEGEKGAPVVNLDTPDDEDSDDCDRIGDTLADEIQANPAAFYVEVQTVDHPDGAIRGQLGPAGD